jgi:hypothetical protein
MNVVTDNSQVSFGGRGAVHSLAIERHIPSVLVGLNDLEFSRTKWKDRELPHPSWTLIMMSSV